MMLQGHTELFRRASDVRFEQIARELDIKTEKAIEEENMRKEYEKRI